MNVKESKLRSVTRPMKNNISQKKLTVVLRGRESIEMDYMPIVRNF